MTKEPHHRKETHHLKETHHFNEPHHLNEPYHLKEPHHLKHTQTAGAADPVLPFPDELIHLEILNRKIDDALKKANAGVDQMDREYRETKRYMAEYRGEIDPHEMFQTELLLKQTDYTGAFSVRVRDKLAKLKDSPYFARIDFRHDSQNPEKIYIGRFSFNYKNELLIFDWRAPVAGMFYDYELGPAGYDAPMGRIDGELTRKRQFKIQNGVMHYAIESSAHVQDDILQKELSRTSDEKMKSIISTIQKEQNRIIRNEKTGTLIIQGVAGSGKTSIALHRIAFLLYRFKNRLNAKNVTILSPNSVFGDYISNVIPELGEEPIYELSFTDIAQVLLERIADFKPDKDPLEEQDDAWADRVRFKSTLAFVNLMDDYITQIPDTVFVPEDYTFGRFTAKRDWIRQRIRAYSSYPLKQRLSMAAEDIFHRFETDNIMEDELPRPGAILKSLISMLTIKNSLALYKDFYKKAERSEMLVMPAKKTLEWADVFPFLYLHAAFEGIKVSQITKHLVIDEMQDYTPIQYAVINLLFPCRKTILGDFGQLLNPCHCHTLQDLKKLYQDAEYVELNKSYRSTYEIMTFAKGIQNISSLEPVERHGRKPAVFSCSNEQAEIRFIQNAIQDFKQSQSASLGIILKSGKAAEKLFHILSPDSDIQLISPESTSFHNGVSITSVHMSKGLEFDEVIVPQADQNTYFSEYDRSLLYIACTRAMHRLTLLYTGECSRLIPDKEK